MKRAIFTAVALLVIVGSFSFAAPAVSSIDYRTAEKLFASGNYREALPLYQKALLAPPERLSPGDIHGRIGDSYFRLADYRRALDSYRRAVRDQRPEDRAQTQYWIGFCCFLVGRDAEAVDEFLKVPALYPDATAWATTSYYWAGRASERMGKREQAAAYYRKAGGAGKSTQGTFAKKKAESVKGK